MVSEHTARFARAVSRILGWIYFLCWSVSFYPQPLLNWKRRSTHGTTIDYPANNVLGFVSYTIYTTSFFFSSLIREQYAARHPLSPETTVRFNDVAFAIHAVILCVLTYSQFWPALWGFKVGRRQAVSKPVAGIFWGSILSIITVILLVATQGIDGGRDSSGWAWIDVMYTVSYIKLVVTIVKYIPQAWVNYKRKSTVGWSIDQILLDITGGVLSISQLVIDSSLQDDWSGLTGNPVKLGLGNVSIFFDIIFITQHYFLYKGARLAKKDTDSSGVYGPLLPGNNEAGDASRA